MTLYRVLGASFILIVVIQRTMGINGRSASELCTSGLFGMSEYSIRPIQLQSTFQPTHLKYTSKVLVTDIVLLMCQLFL